MSNEFYCGNEKGDYRGDGLIEVGFSVMPAVNQRGGRNTVLGNGGKFFYYVGPSTTSNGQLMKNLSGPLGELYGQFAVLSPTNPSGTTTVFAFYLGSVNIGKIQMVNIGGGLVQFTFLRGDGTQIGPTTPNSFGPMLAAWQLVEFHIKPAASGGIFELWVNGGLQIQVLSGNITGPGGEITVDNVRFGTDNNTNVGIDDVMVNNTSGTVNTARPNGVYVFPSYAIGPGSYSQFVNSFGGTDNNYQFTNALPADRPNIGYVGTNTPGQKDSYQMAPPPLEFVGFSAVKVSALIARNGPTISHAQAVIIPNNSPGIAAVNNGNAAVVGTGTKFTNYANGTVIQFSSQPATPYTILTVTDDTHLTLTATYSGTTNAGAMVSEAEIDAPNAPGVLVPVGGFAWVEAVSELDPNTGAPYTAAAIASMEAGLKFNA